MNQRVRVDKWHGSMEITKIYGKPDMCHLSTLWVEQILLLHSLHSDGLHIDDFRFVFFFSVSGSKE